MTTLTRAGTRCLRWLALPCVLTAAVLALRAQEPPKGEALAVPALQGGRPIIRMNAMRMVSEVGRSGYDGAADVCVKCLAKADESDGVKLYAVRGLHHLFVILPNPPTNNGDPGIPEKTV